MKARPRPSSFTPRLVNPVSDLIGGFFSPYQSPSKPTPWAIPARRRWRLSGWSLFFIICIYMKINSFFPTGDASASYWLPCDSLHTSDWVTGFCAVSAVLENPETPEHEDRLLLILCTYLNHLWLFEFVTKQKVVLLLFPFFSGTKPTRGERWLCVHVPNAHTARPPHTQHSGSCFSS